MRIGAGGGVTRNCHETYHGSGLRVEQAARNIIWAITCGLGVARDLGLSCISARFGRISSPYSPFKAEPVPSNTVWLKRALLV